MEKISYLSESDELYFDSNKVAEAIFWLLLVLVLSTLVALIFIKIDITVNAIGVIRPIQERTEIKCLRDGIITKINITNGSLVKKGDLLLELDAESQGKRTELSLSNQRMLLSQIADLKTLTLSKLDSLIDLKKIKTDVYLSQLVKLMEVIKLKDYIIQKLSKELQRDFYLFNEKVISRKEYEDKKAEHQQAVFDKEVLLKDQVSQWDNELQKLLLSLNTERSEHVNMQSLVSKSIIHAPITGYLQVVTTKYLGSMMLAGESICTISPISNLVVECYVLPKEIGLLKLNQKANIYIDAYDYRYFGFITASIYSIEPDVSINDNRQSFKIRCILPTEVLNLKNGYKGVISRGQTAQIRFVLAQRTIWQVLFDSLNDWLKPI